jgi:hypothetical protein
VSALALAAAAALGCWAMIAMIAFAVRLKGDDRQKMFGMMTCPACGSPLGATQKCYSPFCAANARRAIEASEYQRALAMQQAQVQRFVPASWLQQMPALPTTGSEADDPAPLEDGGIVVADVIGWRCWRLVGSFLGSFSMTMIWLPGKIVEGDPDRDNQGVHAFHSLADALVHVCERERPHVIGRVHVWGTVIRHERGLRAQYAKIVAIDDIVGGPPFWSEDYARALAMLRAKYLEEKDG